MATAESFTRNDCIVGKKRISYLSIQRNYRCAECGGRITLKWTEMCESYPQNWHVECAGCGSHGFMHEREFQQQKADAVEVLAGLPAELAAALGHERKPKRTPRIFSLSPLPTIEI